jgi:hypothetical protein
MSIQQNFPSTRPSLNLNFARSQKLDPRITFTRTSSATRVNGDGLIEVVPANSPRFDFDPISGESLGLLVEEARSNFIKNSTSFDSNWVHNQTTPGATAAAQIITNTTETSSPDGTNNAAKIIQANDGWQRILQGVTTTNNNRHTFSIFVKRGNSDDCVIEITGNFNAGSRIRWSFNTETFSNFNTTNISNLKYVKYPNGWYRLSGDFLATSGSGTSGAVWFFPGLDIFGVPTSPAAYTYIYGYQLEEGSFPTSYIPTTTSTVTRTADNASITGSNFSDFYNPSEGTFITEVTTGTTASTGADWFRATDGNANVNSIRLTRSGVGATPQLLISKNNVGQAGPFTSGVQANIFYKLGCYYKNNDFGITNNGFPLSGASIGTSGEVPDVNRLLIASPSTNGYIKRLVYYPSRLPNDQLITLTK